MNRCKITGLTLLAVMFTVSRNAMAGPTAGLPKATDPLAGMGVNIHFTDARPGELEMMGRAGFHWVRMDLAWEATEMTPGVYDFSAYERLLNSLDRFHMRALLILDYVNKFYDEGRPAHTEAGRAAFARWAAAAVVHFKDRGVIWEIWNEPNGDWFWKPKANADDYAKLALAVNQAIHQAAPRELVVGPALSGTNLAFLEVAAKAGVLTDWSAITIHPYLRGGPEHYGPAYDHVREVIKQYAAGGNIGVMCGESGYATTWAGMDEVTQGEYLARLFLFDVMSGVPLTIWYDWHDDGLDPKDQEHHFGIVHNAYHAGATNVYEPKPAYEAALTYADELAGSRFKGRIKTGTDADYMLVFASRAGLCLVAWTTSPKAHEVTIPAANGLYSLTSYDGKHEPPARAAEDKLSVMVDGGPRYFRRIAR